jgi:threonine synthase
LRYISTRGEAQELGFEDVMLAGLASDGGLYVPRSWPVFAAGELQALRGKPYVDVALSVMRPFLGGAVPDSDLTRMIAAAYATFDHPAVTPLVEIDSNLWLLELFHGPTLAFKDVAMQFLARLMDWSLANRRRIATIVGATSGDTGAAAIEAFKSSAYASVFILHPRGRVSEVQRRQMTTVASPNVHNIAIEGTFDDCQAILKALFHDARFRDRVSLAGVNSINWARIIAQIVYYVVSALALGAPARAVSFTVPTGNFGDIYAGLVAKRMGLPIDRLVIAANANDILDRAVKTGRYEIRPVTPTASPSMDIQVSSNFERLLFDAYDRDGSAIRRLMGSLSQSGAFTIDAAPLARIRGEFESASTGEAETAETIKSVAARTGRILDPHTAVGYAVARRYAGPSPMIALATAHPAKFPDAVEAACGVRPGLPPSLSRLMMEEERMSVLPNDAQAVKDFILAGTKNVA